MTDKQKLPARPALTAHGDRQMDNTTAILRDRQTDRLIASSGGHLWDRLVFHCLSFLAADSFVFSGVLFCLAQHFCALFIIFVYLRVLFPVLLSLDSRIISVQPFYSRDEFSFILPPLSIVLNPRLHLFRPWAKQKKINQAPTPGRCQHLKLFVFWVVLFCLAQHYCVILPLFRRRFCFAPKFFFDFPRYLL